MFCPKCGAQLPDNATFCSSCGTPIGAPANGGVQNGINNAQNYFQQAENSLGSEFRSVGNTFNGGANNGYVPGGRRLRTDRNLLVFILLSLVTCGIYELWFIYQLAQDVNTACEGDGEKTSGLVAFILLSIVTCGIYEIYWLYKIGNRLNARAQYYGIPMQENGTTVLMWLIFGSFLCGIGSFVAFHIVIKNTNKVCDGYNRVHGF